MTQPSSALFETLMNVWEASLDAKGYEEIKALNTPFQIQLMLDELQYSSDSYYRYPGCVMQDRKAHCFDGAILAAVLLRRIGCQSLIPEMLPNAQDDDHILVLCRIDGYCDAMAKSNFAGLRFREPIFRNLRELVLFYFEQYYNIAGEKTLISYTFLFVAEIKFLASLNCGPYNKTSCF